MSNSPNGTTTETIETPVEPAEKTSEATINAVLESAGTVKEALAEKKDEPAADETLGEIEEAVPSRRRRLARGGTIVLVTAAAALAIGVAVAMVLRRRGPGEDSDEELQL